MWWFRGLATLSSEITSTPPFLLFFRLSKRLLGIIFISVDEAQFDLNDSIIIRG
jgi:hypothetical protein